MKFERSISVGNVLTGVSIIVVILATSFHLANRITAVEVRVDAMWARYTHDLVNGGHR